MNREQALSNFWKSFGIPAFDENTVPDTIYVDGQEIEVKPPYITYSVVTGKINEPKFPSVSIWYRDISWEAITQKANEILDNINGHTIKYDDGAIIIWGGTYQRMSDPDPMIRRIVPDISYEFLER